MEVHHNVDWRPPGYPQQIGIEAAVEITDKTPDAWRQEVEAWQALGATRLSVYTLDAGLTSVQAHVDALRRFKDATTSAEPN